VWAICFLAALVAPCGVFRDCGFASCDTVGVGYSPTTTYVFTFVQPPPTHLQAL
jgi:hypothetical protein